MDLFDGSHLSISEKYWCDIISLGVLQRFLAEFSHVPSVFLLFGNQLRCKNFFNSPGNTFTPFVKIWSISCEGSTRMSNKLCIQTH